ncbi:unnamed protein product [Allacma fusca]|uniref:Uncharacterized protein n=1 Tax=Allacma fusca TaxID=39272 RepID=A0A8J2LKM4_9HEXA|nr:unnamed protein product [Allacma fusca]
MKHCMGGKNSERRYKLIKNVQTYEEPEFTSINTEHDVNYNLCKYIAGLQAVPTTAVTEILLYFYVL